ncbi:MAG: alpha/beta fold hydrolase, partial [Planctomycetales bacterium]|nr:alpha/beta fold hydrolase [Planctomycetales bacterium]
MFEFECPPFQPHAWMRGPHMQTILPSFWSRAANSNSATQRHQLLLSDGDTLVLHDDCPANWRQGQRAALLGHGLGGSHASPYMQRLAAKLTRVGIRAFRLDLRGHGLGYSLAQQPGHAGRSEDARAAVLEIAKRCPDSPVTVVGVSMGGNIVLKMLGESGEVAVGQVDSAVAVAPPIALADCCRSMMQRESRIYSRAFTKALVRQVKARRRFIPRLNDIPLTPFPSSLWEFDDRFTAPLAGFRNADEYYERSSSSPLLARITVPTLVLAAADDPIVPVSIFDQTRYSPTTKLMITEHGGHVGY